MKKGQQLSFLTWLRACSAVFILLCHYCSHSSNSLVAMLTMVFNIGVELFFIMSGFLVGYKGIPKPCTEWYKKRINRIYLPLWLFLSVLAIMHILNGRSLFSIHWLLIALGLQGTVVHIWGAEQTWFISVLLLCYFLSPVILALIQKAAASERRTRNMAITAVCVMPVLYACFEQPWVYTVFRPVSLYILACAYGAFYDPEKTFTLRKNGIAMLVVVISFGLRLAAKYLCDGTVLYDRIVVPYSQSLAGIAIVYLFEALFSNRKVPRAVQFISDISFEIYLWHYMFVFGPIDVFGHTPGWIAGCIAVTAIVLPIAYTANRIVAAVSGKRQRKT